MKKQKVSQKQKEILILLYRYRGLSNEHLRKLLYSYSKSDKSGQKANVSRLTKQLRENKYIQTASWYPHTKHYIHSLTKKGVDFLRQEIEINPSNPFVGFHNIFGDFEASLLKPPIGKHHLMLVDFISDYPNIQLRNNLYSAQKYENKKLRPDAEILFKNNFYAVEVDTGTERYEQLLEKFQNYYNFYYYCQNNNNNIIFPWSGIFFLNKRRETDFKTDFRYHTILKAATDGFKELCWVVPIKGIEKISLTNLMKEHQQLLKNHNIHIPKNIQRTKVLISNQIQQLVKQNPKLIDELTNNALKQWNMEAPGFRNNLGCSEDSKKKKEYIEKFIGSELIKLIENKSCK